MKKILALVILLMLACLALPALSQGDGTALDIVLVIDQSKSMQADGNSAPAADKALYRADAANMVTAMADVNGSRVALITFDGVASTVFDFQDLSDMAVRRSAMNQISRRITPTVYPGTDYGEALAQAYNLLRSRDDTSNQAMIILLTDGENDFTGDAVKSKAHYVYNEAKGLYEKSAQNSRTDPETANDLVLSVASRAAQKGYTIYSLGLGSNLGAAGDLLSYAATTTGGAYRKVADGKDLPDFFAEMFADRIGSTRQDIRLYFDEGKGYSAYLPILNEYIMEANLFLEKSRIKRNSIRLTSPDEKVYSLSDHESNADLAALEKLGVYVLESDKFMLVKMVRPAQTGIWTLTFDDSNGNQDAQYNTDNLIFSLLLNYDISLEWDVAVTDAAGAPAANRSLKTNRQDYTFYFADSEGNRIGGGSSLYWTDAAYRSAYGEERAEPWFPIAVKGTLGTLDENGAFAPLTQEVTDERGNKSEKPVCTVSFRSNNADAFSGTLDLAKAYLQDGYNMLSSRDTTVLRVSAAGAGLGQTLLIDIPLTNQTPQEGAVLLNQWFSVDNPNPDLNSKNADGFSFALPLADADNERIVYESIEWDGASSDAFEAALDPATGVLTGHLRKDADGEYLVDAATGVSSSTFIIRAHDAVEQQPFSFKAVFTAESAVKGENKFMADLRVRYTDENGQAQEMTVSSNTGAIRVPKFSEIAYELVPHDDADRAYASIAATLQQGADAPAPLTVAGLGGTVTAGDRRGAWTIDIAYAIDHANLRSYQLRYEVIERAPQIVPDAWAQAISPTPIAEVGQTMEKTIRFNPLPVVNNVIDQPNTSEVQDAYGRTVQGICLNLDDLFTDADGEALAYAWQGSDDPEKPDPYAALLDPAARTLTLTNLQRGSGTLTLTATDADNESATVTLQLTNVNLTVKWAATLTVAALAILGAVVLLLIIIELLKPRYAKGAQVCVYLSESIAASRTTKLHRSNRKKLLSSFVQRDLQTRAGIDPAVVSLIQIRPVRGGVQVRFRKNPPRDAMTGVTVGSGKLTTRWTAWGRSSITLRGQTDQYLSVRLEEEEGFGGRRSPRSTRNTGRKANTGRSRAAQDDDY